MEQPTNGNPDTFIERVRLQGYKSIEDVEVTFKPGLNILIGANGSGKTNFVRFLDMVLGESYLDKGIIFQAEIDGRINEKKHAYSLQFKSFNPGQILSASINQRVLIDDKSEMNAHGWMFHNDDWSNWHEEWRIALNPTLISYGVSLEFMNIDKLDKLQVFDVPNGNYPFDGDPPTVPYFVIEPTVDSGLNNLLTGILTSSLDLREDAIISFPSEFIEKLNIYTPVKDIRLAPGYRVESTKNSNGKEILHVRFEFFVDGKWRPWTHLSDGTKRLVYIITEVTFSNNIILLEEPELGIHPHQLSKLMDFLEAAAEHKQIILTTHSPQVLNVLPLDGLDRIIVVRYDKENGTKMSHLTEEEQEQARTYMEAGGLDLSDYWVHSSLEEETASV